MYQYNIIISGPVSDECQIILVDEGESREHTGVALLRRHGLNSSFVLCVLK